MNIFAWRSRLLIVLSTVTPICVAGSIARETQRLPDIPAPSGGESVWIARAMRLNGVPMTIKRLTSATNAAEVLHRYEHKLRTSSDVKTRRSQEGRWHVLAVMTDEYYATIRARNTSKGAEGTVIVTPPLSRVKPKKRTTFPHPGSAALVSLQEYDDEGVEAEHISFVSRRSVGIEARAFEKQLADRGWQVLRNEPAQRHGGHIIEAQQAAGLAFVNLRAADSGGTTILVVWRRQ